MRPRRARVHPLHRPTFVALGVPVAFTLACAGLPGSPKPSADAPDNPAAASSDTPAGRAATVRSTPTRPVFPLREGDHWRWQLTEDIGAGLRVLFIATEPAQSHPKATWELSVDRVDADARAHATWTRTNEGGLPARTDLVLWLQDGELWMQGPQGPTRALDVTVPPDPLSTEKVACVAHFLEDLPGTCSPAPGGPLDIAPGPVQGIVSAEGDAGRSLAQVLVGISTAGLLIPGNKTHTVYADLVAWTPHTPPTPSARVEAFRKAPGLERLDATLGGGLDREEAGALLVLLPAEDLVAGARRLVPLATPADRVALVRVALGTVSDDRLVLLARLVPLLGAVPSPERVDSVTALLPEPDRVAGGALLRGEWPTFAAVAAADPTARLAILRDGTTPVKGPEAEAVVGLFDDVGPAVDLVLPRVATAERFDVLVAAGVARNFDDERLALYGAHVDVLAPRAADPEAMDRYLASITFDEGRGRAAELLLPSLTPPQRTALVALAVEKMTFTSEQFPYMDRHATELAGLTPAARAALLDRFPFDRDEAAQHLPH